MSEKLHYNTNFKKKETLSNTSVTIYIMPPSVLFSYPQTGMNTSLLIDPYLFSRSPALNFMCILCLMPYDML